MANVQLNSDVYAHLLSFVDSPSDLLAAGLVNKELLALARPELLFRYIRCRLGNSAVWEHFNAYPTHAARVRRLELMPDDLTRSQWSHEPSSGEHQERIPNGLDTGEYLKEAHTDRKVIVYSETLLIRAIHNMSNLLDFTWDRWVPAINRGDEESDETRSVYTEDIWTVLRDYSRLRKLKVVDSSFFNSRSIFSSLVRILPLISTYTN